MGRRKPVLKKRKKPEDDHPFGTDSEPEAIQDESTDQPQPTPAPPRKPPKQPIYPDPSSIKTRLRSGNNPHPANAAGIYKRTKADIDAEVTAKKAVKTACMKEIEGRLARAKEMEAAAIRSLADLEDQHAQDDLEEASYDARPRTPDEDSEKGLSESDTDYYSDVDDDPTEADSGGKTKKPTARERRKARAKEVRDGITKERKISAIAKHNVAMTNLHGTDTNPVKRAKVSKDDKEDFDHEWWNFIRNRTAKRVLTKSMGGLAIRDSSPSPREKEGSAGTSSRRQKSAQENREELNAAGGPGFTDNDVASCRPSRSEPFRAGRSTQMARVQLKSDQDIVESPSLPITGRGRSQVANATRRSDVDTATVVRVKGEGNVGESRSQGSLPTWIHLLYKEDLLPTLVDYFGAKSDPWELGGKDGKLFSSVLKDIVRELCPSQHYEPVRSGADMLYTVSRQAISDLRCKFQATAITLVRKEVKTRQEKGKAAIIKYVKDALNPANGAAYWADPDGSIGPQGALLSQFIVKTLAEHIKAIEGSVLAEQCFPVGAFILSITAVMRAFRMFTTGAFINAGPFSKDNIGALTTEWQELPSVKMFLAKPHRQEELLRKVKKHLSGDTEGVNHDARNNQHSGLGQGAHIIMDHSSPPRYDDV